MFSATFKNFLLLFLLSWRNIHSKHGLHTVQISALLLFGFFMTKYNWSTLPLFIVLCSRYFMKKDNCLFLEILYQLHVYSNVFSNTCLVCRLWSCFWFYILICFFMNQLWTLHIIVIKRSLFTNNKCLTSTYVSYITECIINVEVLVM